MSAALVKEFADFLVAAHRQGISFGKSITLGRQHNCLSLNNKLKYSSSPIVTDPFVDTFFRAVLGTHTLDALDYSNYQGANIIHDLNIPLPFELREQYDAVIDGGTLEHVFNFPTALQNSMSLLKPGGSLFLFTPANNLFGHGFYQFSPELFYSVLGPHNGFRVIKMAIVESYFVDVERAMHKSRYAILNPARIGKRSVMISCYPSILLIHAVKDTRTPDNITAFQSDYVATWTKTGGGIKLSVKKASIIKRCCKMLLSLMPSCIENYARSRYEAIRFYSVNTHPCFSLAPQDYFANNWLDRTGDPHGGAQAGQP